MAKKKATPKPNQDEKENLPTKHHHHPPEPPLRRQNSDAATTAAMDESNNDKVQALKSLNTRLLTETVEARKQIESLRSANKSLEAQLARASEVGLGSDVETGVVRVFVESQVGESVESLKREKRELVESLENVKSMLSKACEERDSLKSNYVGLAEEVKALTERERVLSENLERDLEEKEERERLIEELKAEKGEFFKELGSKSDEVLVLRAKVSNLEDEKSAKERMVEALGEEKDSIQRDFEALMVVKEELSKAKLELEKELGSKSKEVDGFRSMVLGFEKDKANKEKLIQGLKTEKASTQRDFEVLKAENRELSRAKLKLESELSSKSNDLRGFRSMVSDLESDKIEKENLIKGLKKDMASIEKNFEALKAKNQELLKANLRLESELVLKSKELQGSQAMVSDLESERAEKEKVIQGLKNEKASAERDFESLKANNNDLSRANIELENALGSKSQEVDDLHTEVLALVEDKADKEYLIEDLKKQKALIESYFESERANNKNLWRAKMELESKLEAQNEEVGSLRVTIMNLKDDNYEKEKLSELLMNEKAALERLLEASKSENQELSSVNLRLESQLRSKTNEIEALQGKVSESERDKALIGNLESELHKTELALKAKTTEASQKELEIEALGQEKKSLEQSKLEKEKEISTMESMLSEIKEELRICRDQSEAAEERVISEEKRLEKIVKEMANQIDDLKKKRSFWTLVSSATTIIAAAASMAYATKGRGV